MAGAEHTSRARRLVGELAVVFLGVLLALAADDFREARSERSEARESLQILLVDLRADSVEFAMTGSAYERKTSEIAWFVHNWNRSAIPDDTLEVRLYTFLTRRLPQWADAAFSGLESSNRIRLIEPDTLQYALLDYYQRRQPALRRLVDDVLAQALSVLVGLSRHVIAPPGSEPGAVWPPYEERVTLHSNWRGIQGDVELRNAVIFLGQLMQHSSGRMREGEEAAGDLMAMIRREIVE